MLLFYVRPYDYRAEGLFARPSKAWHIDDEGIVHETVAHQRRLVMRVAASWVWIEGARENYLADPLELYESSWDTPAAATNTTKTPTDEFALVALVIPPADVVNQIFATTPESVLVSWSCFFRTSADSTVDLNIVNGIPPSTSTTPTRENFWTRASRKAVSIGAAGNKLAQLEVVSATYAWGACVESGPGFVGDARFASQPILEQAVREAELFIPGAVSVAMTQQAQRLRMSFEPEFSSADSVSGNAFTLVVVDTGDDATSLIFWLEGTGPGAIRARAGFVTGTHVTSGSLVFAAGQRLTMELVLGSGQLIVTGATSGNGTFSSAGAGGGFSILGAPIGVTLGSVMGALGSGGGPDLYALLPGAAVVVGSMPDGSASAFSLLGPLEIAYGAIELVGIDQLTLNSIEVVFSQPVLQFDRRGRRDALNPANYVIDGSPGLPAVQYVQQGASPDRVVLFFDARLQPGSLVRIMVTNIVGSGVAVGVDEGERAIIDMFLQTGGVLDSVLEATLAGTMVGASFSTKEWTGDPMLLPGADGVVIVADDPAAPVVEFWFVDDETTVADMEAAIGAVAAHLIRVKIPGSAHVFDASDEFTMTFVGGAAHPALSLLTFGNEVNLVATGQASLPRVDVANPQTEMDAAQNEALGTYAVTATGDLANDHGRAYLRKRINRRLSTVRSGFFHLPDYGLRQPTKALFTATTLRRLKTDVELQVRSEPGVTAATAQVTELRPGVVAIKLRIQDDNGSFELEGAIDFTAE
jgi:hypothetical protein